MMDSNSSIQTLRGKVAIVTGGSRGIGAGIVEELARRGAKVAIIYSSPSSDTVVDQLIAKISKASTYDGLSAVSIRTDLRDPDSIPGIVDSVVRDFGKVDILVNNAGVNKPTPLDTITPEDFSTMFDINVRAMVLMTQAVLPHLAPKNARIINIGSTAARVGVPGISLYCASKLAVEALTRSWAAELGDRGVTVNTVVPGSTRSDLLDASTVPDDVAREAQATPVERRVGEPNDIAQVVAWLASEDSRWISGQCICASGGYRMY